MARRATTSPTVPTAGQAGVVPPPTTPVPASLSATSPTARPTSSRCGRAMIKATAAGATPRRPGRSRPHPPPRQQRHLRVSVTRADGSLTASWPAVDGATSYHITYSSDSGASWSLAALNHPSASITISNVTNSATYIVAVRARNAHGDSGWRNSPAAGPFTARIIEGHSQRSHRVWSGRQLPQSVQPVHDPSATRCQPSQRCSLRCSM